MYGKILISFVSVLLVFNSYGMQWLFTSNHTNSELGTQLFEAIKNCKQKEEIACLLDQGASLNVQDDKGNTPLMVAIDHGHSEVALLLLKRGACVTVRNKDNESALTIAMALGRIAIGNYILKHNYTLIDSAREGDALLAFASYTGNYELAKNVLSYPVNINAKNKGGFIALLCAARGYKEIVRLLLDNGANVNIQDRNGTTALMLAASAGQKEIVKLLLERGAHVNAVSALNWTALTYAVNGHQDEIVKLLLEHGADATVQTKAGDNAVCIADRVFFRDQVVVPSLLAKGAGDILIAKDANICLLIAVKYQHKQLIEKAILQANNVNVVDASGRTALMYAAEQGNKELVELLLNKGAQLNMQDKKGYSALLHAACANQLEMVKFLLSKGADSNVGIAYPNEPALFRLVSPQLEKMALVFLEEGANSAVQSEFGDTLLMRAAENGCLQLVKKLISNGCAIDACNSNGVTALVKAVQQGHREIVKFLLEHRANPHITFDAGRTLLMETNCKDIMQLLLEYNVNVNTGTDNGFTPLIYAVLSGNREIIQLLLDKGAYIDYTHGEVYITRDDVCGDYHSALTHAVCNGNKDVAKLLIQRGAHTALLNHSSKIRSIVGKGDVGLMSMLLGLGILDRDAHDFKDILLECTALFVSPEFTESKICCTQERWQEMVRLLQLIKKPEVRAYLSNPHEACKQCIKLYRSLVECSRTALQQTVLLWASMFGRTEDVKQLLEAGFPLWFINAQDCLGRTALMYAILYDHTDSALLLISHSKNGINSRDNVGKTALLYAFERRNWKLITELLRAGAKFATADQAALAIKIALESEQSSLAIKLLGRYSQDIKSANKGQACTLFT